MKSIQADRGFTLLEIVLTVAILSAIIVAITLAVNPAERLRQARDAQRLSDVRALADAISVMEADISGGVADFDYEGPSFAMDDSCAGQGNPRIFVSVPTPPEGEAPPAPPMGWTYAQVNAASLYDIAGSGWVPVDFTQNTNAPLTSLPVDPTNTFSSGLYYSYVCGASFEVNAALESTEFLDDAANDGGDSANLIEAGSGLTSAPERPAAMASNSAPTITGFSNDGPVDDGSVVTFSVQWSDADGSEQVEVYVCDDASTTMATPHTCDGTTWVDTTGFTGSGSVNLAYTTDAMDVGTHTVHAFVCDDENACSAASVDTFTVNTAGGGPMTQIIRPNGAPLLATSWTFSMNGADASCGDPHCDRIDEVVTQPAPGDTVGSIGGTASGLADIFIPMQTVPNIQEVTSITVWIYYEESAVGAQLFVDLFDGSASSITGTPFEFVEDRSAGPGWVSHTFPLSLTNQTTVDNLAIKLTGSKTGGGNPTLDVHTVYAEVDYTTP